MIRSLLLLLALCVPAWVQAGLNEITADDVAEIRAVIRRQIDAFRRDDAQLAFSLASPGVQEEFGSPQRFLDVVRSSYRAVYRPAAVTFLGLTVIGPDAVQRVQLTDGSGTVWHAYYAMQRQRDGSWRTAGCRLAQPARTIPT